VAAPTAVQIASNPAAVRSADARSLVQLLGWGTCFALLIFTYAYGLSGIPLLDYTEALYAEIAREMLSNHHWIIPHLDAAIYLDKPPLFYWLEATSFLLFGVHIWAARAVSAVAALAGCIGLWFVIRRLGFTRIGGWAALMLASMPGWILMAHTASFDALLATLIALSLLSFFAADVTGQVAWARWGYAFAALGYLTKGPVAPVLVGATLLVYLIWERRLKDLRRCLDPWGFGLFFLIALPWTLLVQLRVPQFAEHFLWVEQFGRYFGTRQPVDYGHGRFWYYLPWICIGAAPWIFVAPLARRYAGPPSGERQRRVRRFGVAWAVTVVLFFSLSADKAAYYILPALPGVALAAACVVSHWLDAPRSGGRVIFAPPLLCALAATLAVIFLWRTQNTWILAAVGAMAASLLAWTLAARYRRLAVGLSAAALLPIVVGTLAAIGASQAGQGSWKQAALIRRSSYSHAPVVLYRRYDSFGAVPFSLAHTVWVTQPRSAELYYSARWQPEQPPFLSRRELMALLHRGPIWVFTMRNDEPGLRQYLPAACLRTHQYAGDRGKRIAMLVTCPQFLARSSRPSPVSASAHQIVVSPRDGFG
jgi:4-amino-4-deoxy-L-arabinose transferase-like glycosyltransferase